MRLVIVSEELPEVAGVYDGVPGEARREEITRRLMEVFAQRPAVIAAENKRFFEAGEDVVAYANRTGPRKRMEQARGYPEVVPEILRDAYDSGFSDGAAATNGTAKVAAANTRLVLGAAIVTGANIQTGHRLAFENRCITVSPAAPIPESCPLLLGHFKTRAQVEAVQSANGKTSRIHVFARAAARDTFQRHGGGILEDGLYILHPKREGVLVPFASFHTDMLQEMAREVRVVMGRIGAKRLVIETVEGMTLSGQVVSRVPAKSGFFGMKATEQVARSVSYSWDPPTFDFEHALDDCVWIRDNASVMTLVDQRRTSSLVQYREFSRVDTTFQVGIDVMQLFKTNFEWASESTYEYIVDFFPRSGK